MSKNKKIIILLLLVLFFNTSLSISAVDSEIENSTSSTEEINQVEPVNSVIKNQTIELALVEFKTRDAIIFDSLETMNKIVVSDSNLLTNRLLTSTGNVSYYELQNKNGTVVGYVDAENVLLVEQEKEKDLVAQEWNKYVSTINESLILYEEPLLNTISNYPIKANQTYLSKEKYQIPETDNVSVSLYSNKNELIGYVSEKSIKIANGPQGVYISYGKYATIKTSSGYTLSNFTGTKKTELSKIVGNTYLARGEYHHIDGTIYYSLYDNNGKWIGYVDSSQVTISDGKQGTAKEVNQYVSIQNSNYPLWQSFKWDVKKDSKQYMNRTFQVKEIYNHINGSSYAAVYDGDGDFYGYINNKAIKNVGVKQGEYKSFGKYVTIKNRNASVWNDFNWKERQKVSAIAGKTLQARGIYYHVNGEDYLSLYDNKGKWQGYINKKFVTIANNQGGAYQSLGKYVTITKDNYSTWQNFNWKRKGTTKSLRGKTYLAKGQYRHFNGSTYYSLYDNKNNWLGYLNKNGAEVAPGAQGIYQHYGKQVSISSNNYPIWQNFNWKKKNNSSSFYKQKLAARGEYRHFNGSTYYSLYDSKGKWQGYINKNGTSQQADKIKKVQDHLNKKYRNQNMGIYVMGLSDRSIASMNGNTSFIAASTGKLPAMYYAQKMIDDKKIDPNKKYLYTDSINQMNTYSYQRDGAGILQNKSYGTYYSIDTMLNWTAKYSDNQGANFLGYYAGRKYDATMRKEISNIIGRTWISPFNITARENALLMEAIYKQDGKLINYMSNTIYDNQRIPKYLPVKVAHKIGDVGSYRHDVAAIYTKEPYVLSVMTKNGLSYETISILSKEIYDIMK